MGDFARYLDALVQSWRDLPMVSVIRTAGFVAARSPFAVLNNTILLAAEALPEVVAPYARGTTFAIWTRDGDAATANAVRAAGFVPDITTRPMLADLDRPDAAPYTEPVLVRRDADPALVAARNGVPPELLAGVPGLRCYASGGGESVLAAQDCGPDVVVSFVATRPEDRGRGLAGALLAAALQDARERGLRGAALQATPLAEPLYRRAGFRSVGRWHEWVAGR